MTKDAVVSSLRRGSTCYCGRYCCLLVPETACFRRRHRSRRLGFFFVFIYLKGKIYIYIYIFCGVPSFSCWVRGETTSSRGVVNRSGVEWAGSRRERGHRRAVACVDDRPPKWCCFCAVLAKREIAKRPMFIIQTPPRTISENGTLHDG